MNNLTFAKLLNKLNSDYDALENNTAVLFARVVQWFNGHNVRRGNYKLEVKDGELSFSLPQCKFNCFSETRIRFFDGVPTCESIFYTVKDDKKVAFHTTYMTKDCCIVFDDIVSGEVIDSEEEGTSSYVTFMDKLIQSAINAELI